MYNSIKEGRGGIVARVVADSISENGKRIATIECEYPRFIHSEVMTHRLFSRNAMSSRAVPVKKMIEQVRNNPAMPIHWGANQAGMQADFELEGGDASKVMFYWQNAAIEAAIYAESMAASGAHKQIVNRILEPFQMMKTVITATEWDNFFWLRRHKDAQPEIKELADCIYQAIQESEPELLRAGEWHTPYVDHTRDSVGNIVYYVKGYDINTRDALQVSASCVAQVSYRLIDNSIAKAFSIYDKLIESKPVHASPVEHQATPMQIGCVSACGEVFEFLEDQLGTTHMDPSGNMWSGNFKGWIQHRQLIDDNACWEYGE